MKYEHLSFDERLHNAIGSQIVEEQKARHAYLHGITYNREEWDYFWYASPNTTWAHAFGRMVGWEEVYMNDVTNFDRIAISKALMLMLKVPRLQGHDLRSIGASSCHVLSSDVIEVAEDGKSARSYYMTPGTMMGTLGHDGIHRGGGWLWERYGSDFVFADGKWQWFHEQVCPDVGSDYDAADWAYEMYMEKISPPPEQERDPDAPDGGPAHLAEPGAPHKYLSITQPVQDTVPPPMPYKTLDDDNTYSLGRNDPTGKITLEPGLPRVHKNQKLD